MTESREHFALDWIKREIDETLKAARAALEAYAESDRDETKMRACLTYLHQVHGTLLMLELTGVTVLTDEMEQLAQALLKGSVPNVDDAQQYLMQGILQLPAFLEEIQKGFPDSRRVVLPLANELRGARGVERFPDPGARAGVPLHATATGDTLKRFDQIDGLEKARRIRAAYQQVLLSILKGEDPRKALGTLTKVAIGLERICEKTPYFTLWRAFSAFVAALSDSDAELTGEVVRLLRRVDAEIKALAQSGAEALTRPLPLDLVKQLVDGAREHGNDSEDIKQLGEVIEDQPEEDRVSISKREAIHTAAAALREELATVKDALDLFVRGDNRSTESLSQLSAPLKQIGSTLSILGFESSRAVIADQVEAINAAVARGKCDDVLLLGVASALLQVDENLAGIAQQRGGLQGTSDGSSLIGEAQVAVLGEARTGLEQVKLAVVDYVSAQWDVNRLADVPSLLSAVRGALAMVPLAKPAEQLGRCARYVGNELMAGKAPDWTELDAFADAISGIDYYLERLCADTAHPSEEILILVERSLTQLGYGEGSERAKQPLMPPPVRPVSAPVREIAPAEPVRVIDDADAALESANDAADATDDIVEAPDRMAVSADASPDSAADDADETIELAAAPVDFSADDEPVEPTAADAVAEDIEMFAAPQVTAPSPIARKPAPAAEFDLVLEDPDEKSSGAVSVEDIDDEGFDLDAVFDDGAKARVEPRMPDTPRAPEPPRPPADLPKRVDPPRAATPTVVPDAPKRVEPPRPVAAPPRAVAPEPPKRPEPKRTEPPKPPPRQIAADVATDVDDDILEIFVEEVGEVLERVDQWLPQWTTEFGNEEALAEVRRAFHTLKGSGRIVGANVIGELAWSVENMLNRVMDATIQPSAQIAGVVREARGAVPALCSAFEQRRPVADTHVATIMEKADILASGGHLEELGVEPAEQPVEAAPSVVEAVAETPVEEIVEPAPPLDDFAE
ncbi:MAG TPA: Hpt domain-containing protein, partial [Pseudomonadales bacterium]|nr:Hpt domain-containing protein [Pseudomonadales bacterium]